jgi:cysteinyl-tRNA synthetase
VHDAAHIGNFRTFTWEDLLRRFLESCGYDVHHIMNITDVDDKTIAKSLAKGLPLDAYTQPYVDGFLADLDALRFRRAHEYPRATRHLPEMIAMIERLIERGHAYTRDGSVYFRIDSFEGYGRLSGAGTRELKLGASLDNDEYEKDDARDFVLWKAPKEPAEPRWDSPFGPGRPGWHIECSAMSMKYLGESFDIHTVGVDNIFPHHENEIAQSEAATGRPFVTLWMHAAHLQIEGEKMAKSAGNFVTLRDLLEAGHSPRVIRHVLIGTHYRKSLQFTTDALRQAETELAKFDDLRYRLGNETLAEGAAPVLAAAAEAARAGFRAALSDDLNISGAMSALFGLVRETNAALDARRATAADRDAVLAALAAADDVLGTLDWAEALGDEAIEALIARRQEARASRDFAESDRIRAELAGKGILLEDTPQGMRWKRRGPA